MKKLITVLLMSFVFVSPAMAGGASCDGSDKEVAMLKTKYSQKAWLGVDFKKNDAGYKVVKAVHASSPAEKASFQKGDVLVAMEGIEYTMDNKKELKAAWANIAPGSEVDYKVKRNGSKVVLAATMGHVPQDIQDQWIAEHMAEQHGKEQLASAN